MNHPPAPVDSRPGILRAYAILTLVDAILNLLVGILAVLVLFCSTIVCFPLGVYPLVLAVLEFMQQGRLSRVPAGRSDVPTWLCVMQIVNVIFSNPLSVAAGIIGLVARNDAQVQAWLGQGPPPGASFLVCSGCGFDLRGTVASGSRACPECGTLAPLVAQAERSIAASDSAPEA